MKATAQQTRFRYANQFVGVLVLLTILIFGMAFLFSGRVREWLDPGGRLKVILPSAGLFGLSEGSVVEVLGTTAGKVIRIVISPDQQMHAEVQIQSDMKAFVRRDSEAVIRKQYGVAGDSFLHISRGIGEPLDWKYAVITAVADRAPTESIGKILDEVRTKVFPILESNAKKVSRSSKSVQIWNACSPTSKIARSLNVLHENASFCISIDSYINSVSQWHFL